MAQHELGGAWKALAQNKSLLDVEQSTITYVTWDELPQISTAEMIMPDQTVGMALLFIIILFNYII